MRSVRGPMKDGHKSAMPSQWREHELTEISRVSFSNHSDASLVNDKSISNEVGQKLRSSKARRVAADQRDLR